jgi:xanthine dehydrogenase accessory factor
MNETARVFTAALAALEEGRRVVVATIVRTLGSTPRGLGSKLLIDPERGTVGTVGGGPGEAAVIEAARDVLRTATPRLMRVDLTDDPGEWSPAVCGGVFDVLLEPLAARSASSDRRTDEA